MLQELRIQNFAIIDDLTLEFSDGFIAITGETGAGKSILVDAVGLLLGARADGEMVRGGAERALIEGVFSVPKRLRPTLEARLQAEGLEAADGSDEIILTREVRASGRSRARVNGVLCALKTYRAIGELLVDIHGQHEHQSLLRPTQHLYLLDRYAGLVAQREHLAALVKRWEALRAEIDALLTDEAALARRVDMLRYQIQEIHSAELRPEEEEELLQERTRLANAERIAELVTEAQYALVGGVAEALGAEDLLAQVALALSKLARVDEGAAEYAQTAEVLSAQVSDLADALRRYREGIEYDPQRLDAIEERLEVISRLKRKYGGSIEAVLAFAETAQAELEAISHSEERLEALRAQEEELLRAIGEAAGALSVERQRGVASLPAESVRELADLRLENARFQVQMLQQEAADGCYVGERRLRFTRTGVDQVEFFMSANPGEPMRPLAKVASGGEAARIMLALKSVLSEADQTPTLIFDEIDQGIGGRMGAQVGRKLWQLSAQHQVLVVTHLAQLAGFADVHYRVRKHTQGGRTVTRVERLDERGRVEELADMLGAETTSARQSAYDILMLARRAKEGRRLEKA